MHESSLRHERCLSVGPVHRQVIGRLMTFSRARHRPQRILPGGNLILVPRIPPRRGRRSAVRFVRGRRRSCAFRAVRLTSSSTTTSTRFPRCRASRSSPATKSPCPGGLDTPGPDAMDGRLEVRFLTDSPVQQPNRGLEKTHRVVPRLGAGEQPTRRKWGLRWDVTHLVCLASVTSRWALSSQACGKLAGGSGTRRRDRHVISQMCR